MKKIRPKVIICLTIAAIGVLIVAFLLAGCSSGGSSYFGAWSPDGSKIAFESGAVNKIDTWVMNADGSNMINLTNKPGNYMGAIWSPNGSKIAFEYSKLGEKGNIYIINTDGSNMTNLTNSITDNCYFPTWSPDGSKIAFESGAVNKIDIWVMNADGSNMINLTNKPGNYLGPVRSGPTWSPDGSKIVFNIVVGYNSNIWIMNADGSNQTRLTGVK